MSVLPAYCADCLHWASQHSPVGCHSCDCTTPGGPVYPGGRS